MSQTSLGHQGSRKENRGRNRSKIWKVLANFRGCLELKRAAPVAWKAVFHSELRELLRILVAISSYELQF